MGNVEQQMQQLIQLIQILFMANNKAVLLIVVASMAVLVYLMQSDAAVNSRETYLSFLKWKTQFHKSYEPIEQPFRYRIWLSNLVFVRAHQLKYKQGLQTFDLEMNQFADLSLDEYKTTYLSSFGGKSTLECKGPQAPTSNLPGEVDWTSKGAVTEVKSQGQCGSCWAFSATGSLEGLYYRTNQKLLNFSEQQLVDCTRSYGNEGCNGGLMNVTFFYVRDHGITTEDKYPYTANENKCRYDEVRDKVWSISDCTEVTVNSMTSLMGAIRQSPVSVAVDAGTLFFQFYRSGVFSGKCGTDLNHGVLAVGYGQMNGTSHYKLKNSWTSLWGMEGYMYILRNGDGEGWCGLQMAASFPL